MTRRNRLPNRRPQVVQTIDWRGMEFDVGVGFAVEDGTRVAEIFATGAKSGSDMQATIADACVVISLALQHGATPADLARSLGRVPAWGDDADAPASVVGAIVAVLVDEAQT